MNKVINLNLSGLLAAYGTALRLEYRLTEAEPTESAIFGLVRCALGIPRGEDWPERQQLTLKIVSHTHEGEFRDFHTVRDAITYEGSAGRAIITQRYYLINSASTVELSGDSKLIDKISNALRCPTWQLYLGRRCCVPTAPLVEV